MRAKLMLSIKRLVLYSKMVLNTHIYSNAKTLSNYAVGNIQ